MKSKRGKCKFSFLILKIKIISKDFLSFSSIISSHEIFFPMIEHHEEKGGSYFEPKCHFIYVISIHALINTPKPKIR